MAGERQLKAILVGDARSLQKALKDADVSLGQTQLKTEKFGESWTAIGAKLGLGAAAVGAVIGVMHEAIGAVGDYNTAIDTATKTLLGQTKSQTETAAALAVARAEADKGRGTYQELAGAMAGLSTVAKTAGLSLASVTETAEILAAINPEEGIKGATFALREAASGDMTSVIERFNLSRTTINKLRAEGVPAIEAVRQAMAELGYDTKFLDTANQSSAKQLEIAKGKFTELAAIVGKPFFDTFIQGVNAATKAVDGPGGVSFAQRLATELDLILHFADGRVFEQLGIDVGKTLFLVTDAFNKAIKAISGGKLNIDGPLKEFYDSIIAAEGRVAEASKKGVADPLAAQLSGAAPGSPLAPAKIQGYGDAVVNEYVKGLSGAKISGLEGLQKQITDQFKNLFSGGTAAENANALKAANSLIAQSLKEVSDNGQVSETTLYRLATVFGRNVFEVQALIDAYARMGAAQDAATAATNGLAAAQRNLGSIQAQAATDLKSYERDIAAAQQAASDHAAAAAEAMEGEQRALSAVGKEAAEVARINQAAIDGLQATAQAHAEQNQRAIAEAQTALSAATQQRQRDSDVAQAAIDGETAAYLRRNGVVDEATIKLAEHYDTIIEGERRAKDAADERVSGLNRAANKEDLDFLTRIKAARESGNAREANALQKQFDARKKVRGSEMEIARAQAAVAGDEFDAKAKQIDKEAKKKDEADATAEKVAGKRLSEVQANADAQAKADAAAIKGAQDAAKADADRYAAQQRGIQDEIDALGDAQKAQAKKDQQAITDAQTLKTERENYWKVEEAGATVALGFAGKIADAAERTATATKSTYDNDVARLPAARANADEAEREAAARKAAMFTVGGGQQNPLADNAPPTLGTLPGGPPTAPVTPQPKGAPNLPPLYDASTSQYPPAGYYKVLDATRHAWYVPNGYRLSDYGIQEAGPSGSAGDATSLSGSGRSSLLDGGAPATAGAGPAVINLHINAPNLTDLGDSAQQRQFAAQTGNAARRAWDGIVRGGGGGVA